MPSDVGILYSSDKTRVRLSPEQTSKRTGAPPGCVQTAGSRLTLLHRPAKGYLLNRPDIGFFLNRQLRELELLQVAFRQRDLVVLNRPEIGYLLNRPDIGFFLNRPIRELELLQVAFRQRDLVVHS